MTEQMYTKPGRLSDVLALIQVLALDEHTHRSSSGLEGEVQGKPSSSESWTALAREQPEFFRVDPRVEHGVSLVARHVLPREEGKPRAALSPEFTATLLQTAITLHDRQIQAEEWWKSLMPLGAALIGSATTLFTLWLSGWCKK